MRAIEGNYGEAPRLWPPLLYYYGSSLLQWSLHPTSCCRLWMPKYDEILGVLAGHNVTTLTTTTAFQYFLVKYILRILGDMNS